MEGKVATGEKVGGWFDASMLGTVKPEIHSASYVTGRCFRSLGMSRDSALPLVRPGSFKMFPPPPHSPLLFLNLPEAPPEM